ncbi:MAG: hypothetical protein AAF086_03590 [Planctomycetota bacterium]
MARRSAKKKTTPSDAPAKKSAPASAANGQAPDGATLLADLEQRCASLRTWHQQASTTMTAREAQLNEQADQIAKQQLTLDKTNQQLNDELKQLAAARAQVEADRSDLVEIRRDLETEWTALRNIRDAQAKLGQELDAERQRLNRRAFKLITPTAAASPKLKAA